MSSIDKLSFVGRRRGARPRNYWQVDRISSGRNLDIVGRELADEFIAYMAGHPDRTDLLERIVEWMPVPPGAVEIAFLARVNGSVQNS